MKKTEHHVHDGEHSTLNKEQLQPNQELKERESKNSENWNTIPTPPYTSPLKQSTKEKRF